MKLPAGFCKSSGSFFVESEQSVQFGIDIRILRIREEIIVGYILLPADRRLAADLLNIVHPAVQKQHVGTLIPVTIPGNADFVGIIPEFPRGP